MTDIVEFELHEVPKSLNKSLRTYRHQRNKINQYWYELVKVYTYKQRPRHPFKKVKITIIRKFWQFLDWDGCVGSVKPIVDGLIHAGIIKDDSYKITGPWDVTQEFRPKKNGARLYVKVERVKE